MESLERCVQKIDDDASDKRENEASRHFAISLYAELARVHKQAVVPFIPRMMASIVRSLPFSADSQQLHEACAKVVTSLARYTLDPARSYHSNQQILCELCLPLLPVLSSKLESAAAGSAICLQALVESEKWKFASLDLQEAMCSKATIALRKQGIQAVTFFHLVKSLAKLCAEASKKHSAEWLEVGVEVLQADAASWQKRLAAAQLITIVLKAAEDNDLSIDPATIVKILDAQRWDKVTAVQMAVTEALETAQGMTLEKHFYVTPGTTGAFGLMCESQAKCSETEDFGSQELSNSGSPRSGASSQESVPSMASSKVHFGRDPQNPTHQGKNASRTIYLSSRSMQTSTLKGNTPVTIPRRVVSEIPASGKRSSVSNSLPRLWESNSLRSSSLDLGNKVQSNFMQIHNLLVDSTKHAEHVDQTRMSDVGERAELLIKTNGNVSLNASCSDSGCSLDSVKRDILGAGQSNICSMEEAKANEALREQPKDSVRPCAEVSSDKRKRLHTDSVTSESDREAHTAHNGFLSKNHIVEGGNEDLNLLEKGGHLKVESHPNDSTPRAPCNAQDSVEGEVLSKDTRQICKQFSSCKIQGSEERFWNSDFTASADSEQGPSISASLQSRTTSMPSCCKSDTRASKLYSLSSHAKLSRHRNSSVTPDSSEDSVSVASIPFSRVALSRTAKRTAKVRRRHLSDNMLGRSNQTGSEKRFLDHSGIKTRLSFGSDSRYRNVKYLSRESFLSSRRSQCCGNIFLGLLFAATVLILVIVAIQQLNQSFHSHVMVPT